MDSGDDLSDVTVLRDSGIGGSELEGYVNSAPPLSVLLISKMKTHDSDIEILVEMTNEDVEEVI